jgi:hypothetical protein
MVDCDELRGCRNRLGLVRSLPRARKNDHSRDECCSAADGAKRVQDRCRTFSAVDGRPRDSFRR